MNMVCFTKYSLVKAKFKEEVLIYFYYKFWIVRMLTFNKLIIHHYVSNSQKQHNSSFKQ